MIVISDTSPILALWKLGHLDLLRRLYGEVAIPPEVRSEIWAEQPNFSTRVCRRSIGVKWPTGYRRRDESSLDRK